MGPFQSKRPTLPHEPHEYNRITVARLIERAHPHPPNQSLLRKNNKDGIKKTARKLRDQAYKDGPFRFSLNTPLGGLRRGSERDPRRTSLLRPPMPTSGPHSLSNHPNSSLQRAGTKGQTFLLTAFETTECQRKICKQSHRHEREVDTMHGGKTTLQAGVTFRSQCSPTRSQSHQHIWWMLRLESPRPQS